MRKIRNTIVATMLFASIMLCSANVNAAARVNGTCGILYGAYERLDESIR